MACRFSETEKWDDQWFMGLHPYSKLAYEYLCDQCDPGGVWKVNFAVAEFRMGFTRSDPPLKIDWDFVLRDLNDSHGEDDPRPHVIKLHNGKKWWLVRYIKFHYLRKTSDGRGGKLLVGLPLHKPVMASLRENGTLEMFMELYPDSIDEEWSTKPKANPTLEDVARWKEAEGMSPDEIALFFHHYEAKNWRDGRERFSNPQSLLSKWRLNSKAKAAPKKNTSWELTQVIKACDDEIAELKARRVRLPGATHETIPQEAMVRIRELDQVKRDTRRKIIELDKKA